MPFYEKQNVALLYPASLSVDRPDFEKTGVGGQIKSIVCYCVLRLFTTVQIPIDTDHLRT